MLQHPLTVSSTANSTASNSANAIIPLKSKQGVADISPASLLLNDSAPNNFESPIPKVQNTNDLRKLSSGQGDPGSSSVPSEKVSTPAATAVATTPSIPTNTTPISDPVSKASVPHAETILSSLSFPESKKAEMKNESDTSTSFKDQGQLPSEVVPHSTPTQTQASKNRYLSAKDVDKIIKSYGFMCAYCEIAGTAADFELDFIVPLNDGGDSSFTNFQPLCAECFAIANPGSDSNSPSQELSAEPLSVDQPPPEAIPAEVFEDVTPLINITISDIVEQMTSDQGEQNYHDNSIPSITTVPDVVQEPVGDNLEIASPITAQPIDDRGEVEKDQTPPIVQSTSYSPSVSVHSSSIDFPVASQINEFIQTKEVDTFPTSSSIPDRDVCHVANYNGKKEDPAALRKAAEEEAHVDIDDEDDDLDLYKDSDFKLEIPVLFPNESIRTSTPSPSVLGDSSTPQNSAAKLKDILKMNASKLNLLQNNLNKLIAEDDDDSSNDSDKYSKKEKRSEEDFWKDLVRRIDDDDDD
eukprot:gene20824-26992_t